MKTIEDIVIEVSKNEIEAMIEHLDCFKYHSPQTRKAKAARTALFEVYKKLKRKLLTKPKRNKRYSLKLKYHELDWTERMLNISMFIDANHFLQTFYEKVHQKLDK